MATFKDKITNLINSQVPDFIVQDHPKFLEFVKAYYTFMESAELRVTSVQTTDGILLETETNQENNLLLDASRLDTDRTQLDAGDKIILESSTYGKFTRGETITGQTSNATAVILSEDLTNGRLFISAQDKFIDGETILGNSSNASATINSYRPNPVNNIQDLLNFRDPDKVISSFLTKFRNEFLNTLPETLSSNVDKRKLIKNVKSLYRAKGTSRGHELFFRLLFNENSETIYPRDQVLRASDGKWDSNLILRAIATIGDTQNLIGRQITGQSSGATATIENAFKFIIGENEVTEFILNEDTILGTFTVGEEIRGTENDTDDIFIKATITGIPSVISLTNDGTLYEQGEILSVVGGGTGASINVGDIGRGSITNLFIDNGGSSYEIGDDLVFTNTGTGGGSARAKVSVVNGGITQEESTSSTDDHIVLEDETVRGDPYTGNKIVQESGTGSGDITDIRIISGGSNYLSLPTVVVDDTNGSNAVVYAYGSEIGRIQSIDILESGAQHELSPSPPTISLRTKLLLTNVSGSFSVGENVSAVGTDGSTSITATIVSYDNSTSILTLSNATGVFGTDVTITSDGGATATIKIFDQGTASVTVAATAITSGKFINEDGHLSETTMRLQDSLYYQDFSYVIKVGRSINEWRDTFKKTMHAAGFYFTGQVDITERVDVQLRNITTINSGKSFTPIQGIINTLFSTIFGRRLGTDTDGTTLRVSPLAGVDPDFNDSTSDHFTSNTRDVTLTSYYKFNNLVIIKEKTDIRSNTTRFGVPAAGPTMKGVGNLLLGEFYSSQVRIDQIADLRLTGTQNTSIDGELNNLSDFNYRLKTNLAIPAEIWINSSDSFDEDQDTFDQTNITMDAA
jgi:hypothetical protein